MKRIILLCMGVSWTIAAIAQPTADTLLRRDSVYRGAWNQRPDSVVGKNQPVSTQPLSNPPMPAPTTKPTNNPTSGQTYDPQYNEPIQVPPPLKPDTFKKSRKPVVPFRKKEKPPQYDTLPGTNRNG